MGEQSLFPRGSLPSVFQMPPSPSAAATAASAANSPLHPIESTPLPANKLNIFIYAAACITFSYIAISAAGEAISSAANTSRAGYTSLSAIAAATAFLTQKMVASHWRRESGLQHDALLLRKMADADIALILLAILVPCNILLLDFNPLPISDNRQGNDLMTAGFLLKLGVALDLPPKHCFVQFLLTFPFFMFLDYRWQQEHPVSYPGALVQKLAMQEGEQQALSGLPAFRSYFMSRGLLLLLLGLLAQGIFLVLAMKRKQSARLYSCDQETRKRHVTSSGGSSTEHSTEQHTPVPPPAQALRGAPLETLRLGGLFVLMDPLLEQLELNLSALAEFINEEMLVSLLCVPVGLWYISLALLSRVLPKWVSVSSVAADEWMVVLSIFFVLGRHSCKVDMLPLIGNLQGQLLRSQDILADILPSHVLGPLLSTVKEGHPVTEGGGAHLRHDEGSRPTSRHSSRPTSRQTSAAAELSDMSFSPLHMLHEQHSDKGLRTPRMSMELRRSSLCSLSVHLHLSPLKAPLLSLPQPQAQPSPAKVTESHECVSIFFSDICDFSAWVHQLPAAKVMQTLDDLYSRLDDIIIREMPGLYKVETIGDGYMVAANLMTKDEHHANTILAFAFRAQEEASKVLRPDKHDGSSLQLRIGVHSGPVVSGSVGNLRRNFCLFGNTINMASRTQTSCPPGCIQITEACQQLAAQRASERVVFRDRGLVAVKGAARPLHMYLVMTKEMLAMSRCLKAAGVDL